MGLGPDDVMILQPTRVVPRKGIEHAINLVKMLGDPKYKLVVTHEAGDEGMEYRTMLAEYARQAGVDLRFFATRVSDVRKLTSEGKKVYTLWDIYPFAALVTYPSLYEGFGNAFLEVGLLQDPDAGEPVRHLSSRHRAKGIQSPDHGRLPDPGGRGRSPPYSGRRDIPEKDGRTQLPDRQPAISATRNCGGAFAC